MLRILEQLPVDHEEAHRNAYNAAFYELGLSWHWDAETYHQLQAKGAEREQIRIYLQTEQSHLLKAYEADFLIDAIQTTKERCYAAIAACGPCVAPYVNWAEVQRGEVGV